MHRQTTSLECEADFASANVHRFKRLFPGFGLAVVAFTAYVAFDELTHPHNVEGLKKAAKEDQESKVGIATLLKGGDSKH